MPPWLFERLPGCFVWMLRCFRLSGIRLPFECLLGKVACQRTASESAHSRCCSILAHLNSCLRLSSQLAAGSSQKSCCCALRYPRPSPSATCWFLYCSYLSSSELGILLLERSDCLRMLSRCRSAFSDLLIDLLGLPGTRRRSCCSPSRSWGQNWSMPAR